MKRLFGNLNMNWVSVLLFAVIVGVYTGAVMLIPALSNTSFQDIGISYEWWVIFAVIIVVNCKKSWDAMLKCFVFFLISQPLIYGVEVFFGTLTMELALYYYRATWLPMTFLTLPGGFIAYYCKKQNLFGSLILGLGNTIQMLIGASYLLRAFANFPYHLLSAVVCFGSIFIMTFSIQGQKKYRLISIVSPIVFSILLLIIGKTTGLFYIPGLI